MASLKTLRQAQGDTPHNNVKWLTSRKEIKAINSNADKSLTKKHKNQHRTLLSV